jgi:hypothetical protein
VGVLVVDGVLTDKGSTAKAKPVVLPQPPKLKGKLTVALSQAKLAGLSIGNQIIALFLPEVVLTVIA